MFRRCGQSGNRLVARWRGFGRPWTG